eukprot:Em0011g89a
MAAGGQPQEHVGTDAEVATAVTAILTKVQGAKSTLSSFIGKMEIEQLTWPSVLESFAALSGQMSTVMKQLANEKTPPLHNRLFLPLQVSSDRDAELEKTTEGRVPILHHEIVPHYLRTKLDLDLEAKLREQADDGNARESAAMTKEISRFNEILIAALERVKEAKDEQEDQKPKSGVFQPTSTEETRKLTAMYLGGVGLATPVTQRKAALLGIKQVGKAPPAASVARVDHRQSVAPYPTTSPLKNR